MRERCGEARQNLLLLFKLLPWCGKKFTAKQAEALLAGKLVSLKVCKSRAGKTFDCKVRLDGDGEIQPVWDKKRR